MQRHDPAHHSSQRYRNLRIQRVRDVLDTVHLIQAHRRMKRLFHLLRCAGENHQPIAHRNLVDLEAMPLKPAHHSL